ncbi:hypothetical protein PVAP13_1KG099154 [Panicum virgatum]|uniref:Uncharacterized protein n=1 Tax=Panicum virgatum TaxID=38727 RepID=A0A8T0XGY7_PANVG|nr:hypothetical protein PVAP13_1KG099154 [Panicum virgatum]
MLCTRCLSYAGRICRSLLAQRSSLRVFFLSLFSLLNLCMSLRLWSSASVQFLFAIRVSSHRIR